MQHAKFKSMMDGTTEEFAKISKWEADYAKKTLVSNIVEELKRLDIESPYPVTRYEHSLQSATRAYRDGADEEVIVAALLHDIGDNLAMHNHTDMAVSILKPYVSEKTLWLVEKHAIFQGYYFWHHLGKDRNARDQYKDHPWYDDCVHFCEHYDQAAFDPDYDTLKLEFFMPMLEKIFSRKPYNQTT